MKTLNYSSLLRWMALFFVIYPLQSNAMFLIPDGGGGSSNTPPPDNVLLDEQIPPTMDVKFDAGTVTGYFTNQQAGAFATRVESVLNQMNVWIRRMFYKFGEDYDPAVDGFHWSDVTLNNVQADMNGVSITVTVAGQTKTFSDTNQSLSELTLEEPDTNSKLYNTMVFPDQTDMYNFINDEIHNEFNSMSGSGTSSEISSIKMTYQIDNRTDQAYLESAYYITNSSQFKIPDESNNYDYVNYDVYSTGNKSVWLGTVTYKKYKTLSHISTPPSDTTLINKVTPVNAGILDPSTLPDWQAEGGITSWSAPGVQNNTQTFQAINKQQIQDALKTEFIKTANTWIDAYNSWADDETNYSKQQAINNLNARLNDSYLSSLAGFQSDYTVYQAHKDGQPSFRAWLNNDGGIYFPYYSNVPSYQTFAQAERIGGGWIAAIPIKNYYNAFISINGGGGGGGGNPIIPPPPNPGGNVTVNLNNVNIFSSYAGSIPKTGDWSVGQSKINMNGEVLKVANPPFSVGVQPGSDDPQVNTTRSSITKPDDASGAMSAQAVIN
jgi:hypothetical protein